MSPGEPIFCPTCGTVDDAATLKLRELESTLAGLGVEIAKKQRTINALRKEGAAGRPPEYDDAMEVCRYWKGLCMPRARELEGPRVLAVIARLQSGWSKAELMQAVWGYSCRPNLNGKGRRVRSQDGGRRYVELDLLMRDSKHVEDGIRIAEAERNHDQGLMHEGATRHMAELCDCNHPRAYHALFRLHLHDACMEEGCECAGFDDSDRQHEKWCQNAREILHRESRIALGEESVSRVPSRNDNASLNVETQGSLL